MTIINHLTPEQIAKFDDYVAEWTAIRLCTEPADRPRAERAIAKMYEIAGLAAPRVVWCGSPMSMALTRAVLFKMPASVGDSVRYSVRDAVSASVWNSVCDSISTSVRDAVSASVWDSVSDSVRASVLASVRASVSTSVSDSVRDSVLDSVYGQHEANWLAFYRYFHDVVGLKKETQRLEGLWELARSAGWTIPFRDICFVSERHATIIRDDQGRLHNPSGPACAYPDGWSLYYWHGTTIPEDWIEHPETLTASIALRTENLEQRRAACEMLGWDRILNELDAVEIDRDPDPEIGILLEVNLPDSGRERFLRARCGTGRQFALPVPSDIPTALAANAWTYDIPADLLKQKEHRT
jgi:hypothetical protein